MRYEESKQKITDIQNRNINNQIKIDETPIFKKDVWFNYLFKKSNIETLFTLTEAERNTKGSFAINNRLIEINFQNLPEELIPFLQIYSEVTIANAYDFRDYISSVRLEKTWIYTGTNSWLLKIRAVGTVSKGTYNSGIILGHSVNIKMIF